MNHNLAPFGGYLPRADWPYAVCPTCEQGLLEIVEITPVTSALSLANHANDSWEPDWDEGTFHGILKCTTSNCAEQVVVSGFFKTIWSKGVKSGGYYGDLGYEPAFQLRFAIPAIPVMTPPQQAPAGVKEAIRSASELIWIEPNAAGNRLRYAVELLLTDRKVARFTINKAGNRVRLDAHSRIERFKKVWPDAGEALEAVKWIGNEGSHQGSLAALDVLAAAEVLEHALQLVYNKNAQEIQRHIKRINKAKGVPKKTAKVLFTRTSYPGLTKPRFRAIP